MNKEEFLDQAGNLLNEAFVSLLEKAYNEGYEQGKQDQIELTQPTIKENNIDWADLSLPCRKRMGTMKFYCGDDYGKAYGEMDNILTLDEAKELLEYCIFDLRISVTRSTGTRWPILELVSAKGVRLRIKQFNYEKDPDGKVVDIWINAPTNTAVKSSVLRVTINTIEPLKQHEVKAEIIEGVFKGQDAIHIHTKNM
jgi:hypothetical protein